MKKLIITFLTMTLMFFYNIGIAFGEDGKIVTRESVISEIISGILEIISEEEIVEEEEPQGELYRITYYCGCSQCCGKWSTEPPIVGAYGRELIDGYSCACPLPNGTEIEIKGYGTVRVDDTTSKKIVQKYNGKIIDIYVQDHTKKPEGIQDYMEILIKED